MSIVHAIIHALEKKPNDSPAALKAASEPLPNNETLDALLLDLNQHFNAKPSKHWASFQPLTETCLPQQLTAYLDGQLEFIALSLALAEHWRSLMQEHELFLTTHLCVLHYRQGAGDHLLIALLPQRSGLAIGEDLDLATVRHLDCADMHLAARINLSEWRNNSASTHYISHLKSKGGKKLADAFMALLHGQETGDAPTDTRALLKAFSDYVEEADLEETPTREKTQALVSYAKQQSQRGEPVALSELSEVLDEDNPRAFYDHIRNKDYGLSDYVPTDRRTLNQFQRFTGRAEGLSISFEAHLLGSKIEYDPARDMLIIRQLPTQLKDQLNRSAED